jgi:hypothetical protein
MNYFFQRKRYTRGKNMTTARGKDGKRLRKNKKKGT